MLPVNRYLTMNTFCRSMTYYQKSYNLPLKGLTGFPQDSLYDLDESMSDLRFEKDNLLSLTKVCKTYILNTKHSCKLYFLKSLR